MWTDESRAKAIKLYLEKEPTAENSMEMVTEVAEELGETPNGVRMILTKAEVYIKKSASAKKEGAKSDKPTRVGKEAAQNTLKEIIEANGLEVDEDIIGKMTGKAAQYFAKILQPVEED